MSQPGRSHRDGNRKSRGLRLWIAAWLDPLGKMTAIALRNSAPHVMCLRAGEFLEPLGQLLELPGARKRCGFRPSRCLIGKARYRRLGIHDGNRAIEPKLLGKLRK